MRALYAFRQLAVVAMFIFSRTAWLSAQATARVTGVVTDPDGAVVEAASVELSNSLNGYHRSTTTQVDGTFTLSNLPFSTYSLVVEKVGFAPHRDNLSLRSNVPVRLSLQLKLAEQIQNVSVEEFDRAPLVEPEITGTRIALDAKAIARFPVPTGGRGLESVLVSFPGFAANANGAIHPRGAHNQMSYVIDGMPVSDQLTGSFANSVDPSIIQAIELFTGNIPAEFGSKVSGVANITSRSGLGSRRQFSGSLQLGAAQFDTAFQNAQLAGGGDRWGYFASVTTVKSNRFLDQVSLDNLHNGGNCERAFARFDYHASPENLLRAHLMTGRSSFQLANLRSQHAALQDQRQNLRDFSGSVGWVRTLSQTATLDTTASYRTTMAELFPSPGDTPVTAAQARQLSTLTVAGRINVLRGAHGLRAGFDLLSFPVSESFSFGVTDPEFNRPSDEGYLPTLLAFDLSRGGRLFQFSDQASGKMYTGFLQDTIRWRRLSFTLGLRYDGYRFLVDGDQWQPRLGVSFYLSEPGTVLRASYNRNYQTPPNENLLLSNSDLSSVLVPENVRASLGGALIRIRPERQNVYEVGIQQAISRWVSINGAYYRKDSRDMQDNDNFFNTGIIFPTALDRARVKGAEMRASVVPYGGFSGSISLTHYSAVVTPPFTGGLFLGSTAIDLLTAGPFIIDHDQKLGVHGMIQYNWTQNLWTSGSIRYDSGLVSNPSDPSVVAQDPDFNDLLPFVNLAANPARVRPRTVVDMAFGYDRRNDKKQGWSLQLDITNVTNKTALYNFQSIFVGTRLVQPRTVGAKIRWHW
ncbi:MAG: TonB-dependent receptor [Acidimicrobiia bacterium]|nr:TonB-dependent receptor [Acidimicrobiia bacterium]